MYYYGHSGNQSDCWGCHGFTAANVDVANNPANAIIPEILSVSDVTFTEGKNEPIELSGESFVNLLNTPEGKITFKSWAKMTRADSSQEISIAPAEISNTRLAFDVPGYMPAGNYRVRLHKEQQVSNAKNISLLPEPNITAATCTIYGGSSWATVVIKGDNFGKAYSGMGYLGNRIGIETNLGDAQINEWSDTRIVGSYPGTCPTTLTVNTLFGSVSANMQSMCAGCLDQLPWRQHCSCILW